MQQDLCIGTVSVCLSVLLFVAAIVCCSGFAAVGPACRRYRSIVARLAPQQSGIQPQVRAGSCLQMPPKAELRRVLIYFHVIRWTVLLL